MFYHRNRKKILIFSSIMILLFLAGFSYGYFTHIADKQLPDDSANSLESDQGLEELDESMEAALEVSKTEGNWILTLERTYTICKHTITDEMPMGTRYVGKTSEELSLAYPLWQLVEFTPEKVMFTVDIDGYCPEHYVIKEEDGYLVVYRPEKETGALYPVEKTGISYDRLTPDMQDKVDIGLAVDTIEDVEYLMEDWES